MPNIQSAKKIVRQDKKRKSRNDSYFGAIKGMMKSLLKSKGKGKKDEVKKTYSMIDKAAKRKVIHKNKAARLKSRVSRLAR
ncbi:MAG: 30S ribosomal protein S20 [bacterium]|nr:30S ribosomal protein S20 [bacterium]